MNFSVWFSHSAVSDYLRPYGLQHARIPCPSLTPGACSNPYPLSPWCHPTLSSSVSPFSFRLQSFPASESFPVSQFFTSGDRSIGASASASVLPVNIQGWFPLGSDNHDHDTKTLIHFLPYHYWIFTWRYMHTQHLSFLTIWCNDYYSSCGNG